MPDDVPPEGGLEDSPHAFNGANQRTERVRLDGAADPHLEPVADVLAARRLLVLVGPQLAPVGGGGGHHRVDDRRLVARDDREREITGEGVAGLDHLEVVETLLLWGDPRGVALAQLTLLATC